ncbi:S49 family peptidase [Metarhizobium album]|uniref:S49 family peptidase n=1 Tax=Metarhizobium album TaxID=2182425 RepID=UPI0014021782|nr:S49 family peptidase [Rhizobium album]
MSIAERSNEVSPQALEAYRSASLSRAERATERDGVAIIRIEGPLFKKANLFVSMSGATSYEMVRRDLQVALDDKGIHSIALYVDSPGGEANGCDELASAIYAARSKKPITAFVSGMAASGGYWIASAASRVVISDAAMLGSIGVVLGLPDRSEADRRRGVRTMEFVSSQSPGKRPDPSSDRGRAQIQTLVDDLAGVFVAAVAKHRGVSVDTVTRNFGGGGMKVGAKAVAAGMADDVGQFEAVIAGMIRNKGAAWPSRKEPTMSIQAASHAGIVAAAAAQETERCQSILTCQYAKSMPGLIHILAFETTVSHRDALTILAAIAGGMATAPISGTASRPEPGRISAEAAAAGWQKAVATTNGGASAEDLEQRKPKTTSDAWAAAIAQANRFA